MKILVDDLKPNPYRKIDKYPIDKEKVEELKNSIEDTGFWDNVVARKKEDYFEIAYGHHRLQALKELDIKEVDIPVKDLDDVMMIKIMANENMDTWKTTTSVMLETVLTAKEYLENELSKYETWEEFRSNKSIRPIIKSEPEFRSIKGKGEVGQTILTKFLGKNWKQWMIQKALSIIKDSNSGIIDKEAILELEQTDDYKTIDYANLASNEIKKHGIKKEDQKEVIKKAKELYDSEPFKKVKTGREKDKPRKEEKFKAAIEKAIEEVGYETDKENYDKVFKRKKNKIGKTDINKAFKNYLKDFTYFNTGIDEILENWEYIDDNLKEEFLLLFNMFFTSVSKYKDTIFKTVKLLKGELDEYTKIRTNN